MDDDECKAPCLEPTQAMSYNEGDNKASCAIGRKFPISALARQSACVIMEAGKGPQVADHDFNNER
eukprot:96988-Ditylum_brightwellii.AAC.1